MCREEKERRVHEEFLQNQEEECVSSYTIIQSTDIELDYKDGGWTDKSSIKDTKPSEEVSANEPTSQATSEIPETIDMQMDELHEIESTKESTLSASEEEEKNEFVEIEQVASESVKKSTNEIMDIRAADYNQCKMDDSDSVSKNVGLDVTTIVTTDLAIDARTKPRERKRKRIIPLDDDNSDDEHSQPSSQPTMIKASKEEAIHTSVCDSTKDSTVKFDPRFDPTRKASDILIIGLEQLKAANIAGHKNSR